MTLKDGIAFLSPSDLSTHMSCKHATSLDIQLQLREIKAPQKNPFSLSDVLIKRGIKFEKEFLEELRLSGKQVLIISEDTKSENKQEALKRTINAMKSGVDVIYQGRLREEILTDTTPYEKLVWSGWVDFMIKVDQPSELGAWSYEVWDTKLAKETRAGAILQICMYSEILGKIQGYKPEFMHIKTPAEVHKYRYDDYAAYYRMMKKSVWDAVVKQEFNTYPDVVTHCEICQWSKDCDDKRREDDHLSFVAGIGRTHIKEVDKWGINTLTQLSEEEHPLPKHRKPERGAKETYNKLVKQAKLQKASVDLDVPVFELLPAPEKEEDQKFGFFNLPEPNDHDIFLDFEGDRFVEPSGLEYLFGWYYQDKYYYEWAFTEKEEKAALKKFMKFVKDVHKANSKMHVYHYNHYEVTAIKRMTGKYSFMEDERDEMLRKGLFVDLYRVTKNAVIIGIESYSLKEVERVFEFKRKMDLAKVVPNKMFLETCLQQKLIEEIKDDVKKVVLQYNTDDCFATSKLRNWLEVQRQQMINNGNVIPRPEPPIEKPLDDLTDHLKRINLLKGKLLKGVNEDSAEFIPRTLLSNMLDWYRQEGNAELWKFFELRESSDEDLLEEDCSISKLKFIGRKEIVKQSFIHYYSFPDQIYEKLEVGDQVKFQGNSAGTVDSIDGVENILGLIQGKKSWKQHPTHIWKFKKISAGEKCEAIIRLAEHIIANGMTSKGSYQAACELLQCLPPPNRISALLSTVEQLVSRLKQMDGNVLPVQGPPGTGKSYSGSKAIIELLRSGKKIGITAHSHKVITNLVAKVYEDASKAKIRFNIIQNLDYQPDKQLPNWEIVCRRNDVVLDRISAGFDVVAGTSFMWALPDFFNSVDYLFVDEAGQLSLIDTLAVAHAAKNLVLLGDPQQLNQPIKGCHPEGTSVSALQHILGKQQTITSDKGLFLEKTWRLHPNLNAYVSEMFYESRLEYEKGNERQRLVGNTKYINSGIYFELMEHSGNQSRCSEEVKAVTRIVNQLMSDKLKWIDRDGNQKNLEKADFRIISPYNAQVNALKVALQDYEVGTVDKFQGQEAPVVIYSMAASTLEDAPRGVDFLFDLHRLNVAVSRAKGVVIVVCSKNLLKLECKSAKQMKMVNAFCRLLEVKREATILDNQ